MGPAPTWKSDQRGRMEAVRSLLRPSTRRPASSSAPSHGSSARSAGVGDDAPEWAAPSFARVRARPSSLYAPLRSSPTFPLSHRRRNPSVAAPSAYPDRLHASLKGTVRSQSTHATQTEADAEESGEWSAAIRLGAFGEVADMTLETVNFLIRVLEDRRHDLLHNGDDEEVERSVSSHAPEQHTHRWQENASTTSQVHERRHDIPGVPSLGASVSPRRRLRRTNSYEALVRLEEILESRHQQLMQEGIDADECDEEQDEDILAMTDIQDEVKRIYGSLRAEELAENDSRRGN